MKILLINYRFFFSGGPEKYLFGIIDILKSHGHEVIPFSVHAKKNENNPYEKFFADPIGGEDATYFEDYKKTPKTMLQMLDRQFYSLSVKKRLEKLIIEMKPDICYLMHHYNKLSPSVIDACKKHKIPVVMRLSDFFMICPNALLIRDGRVCEECLQRGLWRGVKNKCVKNSLFASTVKVAAMKLHRILGLYEKVSYIISPSSFTISKVSKIFKKNNFVHVPTFIKPTEKYNPQIGKYALYVGRTEEEKGVMTLIKAAEGTDLKVKIVGKSSTEYDQKIRDYLKSNNIKNVEFPGPKYGKELQKIYRNARFVVVPAEWYENMPNVVLEAMLFSKPIIASDIGSLKELIQDGRNGLLFKPKDVNDLKDKMKKLFKHDKLVRKMGRNAYHEAVTKYNPDIHYEKLIKVFEKAVKEENLKWKR
ncbi:glycosyltransferase family 4 protein [Candidatus Woesearchaeota archaeon]|nr:glycosyltransferase family 4 protein [Candidatus Woesearchaeota archaeon]